MDPIFASWGEAGVTEFPLLDQPVTNIMGGDFEVGRDVFYGPQLFLAHDHPPISGSETFSAFRDCFGLVLACSHFSTAG